RCAYGGMIRGGRMLPDEHEQGPGTGGAGGSGSPDGPRAGDDLTVPAPADQPGDASATPQPVETRPIEMPDAPAGGPVAASGPVAAGSWQAVPGAPPGSFGPMPPDPARADPSWAVAGPAAAGPPPGWPAPSAPAEPPGAPPTRRAPVWRRPRPVVAVLAVIALAVAVVVWGPWIAPAAVTQVHGVSPTGTSIVLQWARSSGHTGPSRYLVLRDGAEVGSVPGSQTSYTDSGLRPGHSYSYSVVARSWLRRSVPAPAVTVRAITPSPTRLTADRATVNSARLHWSAPDNSPAPDKYEILRDGYVVHTVAGAATSYLDAGLSPATSYRYQIAALWDVNESDPT